MQRSKKSEHRHSQEFVLGHSWVPKGRNSRPKAESREGVLGKGAASCLGGAVAGRRTRDRKVAGPTPGRGAIKSTRSTQPSIPPG